MRLRAYFCHSTRGNLPLVSEGSLGGGWALIHSPHQYHDAPQKQLSSRESICHVRKWCQDRLLHGREPSVRDEDATKSERRQVRFSFQPKGPQIKSWLWKHISSYPSISCLSVNGGVRMWACVPVHILLPRDPSLACLQLWGQVEVVSSGNKNSPCFVNPSIVIGL